MKISSVTAFALKTGGNALSNIPDSGETPVDDLARAVGSGLVRLGEAGGPDSDGGRTVTPAEAPAIARGLISDLEVVAEMLVAAKSG